MTFNMMNIPKDKVRQGEDHEECFCRIMETYMGEISIVSAEFTYEVLGAWTIQFMRRMPSGAYPVAWIEDEEGNMVEYFVFMKDKTLKHWRMEE